MFEVRTTPKPNFLNLKIINRALFHKVGVQSRSSAIRTHYSYSQAIKNPIKKNYTGLQNQSNMACLLSS
jgi:hypothetical protein